MSDNINHIKTDNLPLLDELIYNLKKELLSAILKDDDLANNASETLDVRKASDTYLACVEGRARPEIFHYEKTFYYNFLSDFTDPIITQYIKTPDTMDTAMRNAITARLSEYYINNYVEGNEYYRMLNGQPPLNKEGVYLPVNLVPRELLGIDLTKTVDKYTQSQADILYELGIMDKLIDMYPGSDYEYLQHLGSRSISIYAARMAPNFSLLYVSNDVPSVIYDMFREKVELNRNYTIRTVYTEAYKFQSDYYNNFIRIFILVQVYVDIIAEMPGMIIRREIFDRRMVELLFKTNGIDYFPEIPMTYQIAMIRNLNTLLRYKSTNKNIIDICSLFGFDNITVFKYYLLKDRRYNKATKRFNYNIKQIPNPADLNTTISTEDLDKDFNLKFVKVPIEGVLDDYLHDGSKVKTYDDVVLSDKYWQGDRSYDEVKADILNLEFNHYQSKYISIDSMYDMAEMSFQLCYFFNMIFDNVDLEEMLTLDIPYISGEAFRYKFVDIICYLISLGCLYEGMEDLIMDTRSKILYIKGFNFKADMQVLATYVANKGFTLKDLGVDNFQIPTDQVLNYKQLMYIFTTNKNIYDHVVKQIYTADNKRIYDIYYKLYDSLMIEKLTFDFFKNPDGTLAKTFKEFLAHRDLVLYDSIVEIENMTDHDERIERITDVINNCVYVIESSVDLSQYKFIFSKLPTVSAESIKQYIFKIVNFFKSYKVQIESMNVVYVFDDRLDNWIKVIDNIIITHHLTKVDVIHAITKLKITSDLTPKEKMKLLDKLYISSTSWVNKFFHDNMYFKEKVLSTVASILKQDTSDVYDKVDKLTAVLLYSSYVDIVDKRKELKMNTTYKEMYNIMDKLYIDITYHINKFFYEKDIVKDNINTTVLLNPTSGYLVEDDNSIISQLKKIENLSMSESISITYN